MSSSAFHAEGEGVEAEMACEPLSGRVLSLPALPKLGALPTMTCTIQVDRRWPFIDQLLRSLEDNDDALVPMEIGHIALPVLMMISTGLSIPAVSIMRITSVGHCEAMPQAVRLRCVSVEVGMLQDPEMSILQLMAGATVQVQRILDITCIPASAPLLARGIAGHRAADALRGTWPVPSWAVQHVLRMLGPARISQELATIAADLQAGAWSLLPMFVWKALATLQAEFAGPDVLAMATASSTFARLRLLLASPRTTMLRCVACDSPIAQSESQMLVSRPLEDGSSIQPRGAEVQASYINMAGITHTTAAFSTLLYDAVVRLDTDAPCTEDSWWPGYAWTPMSCSCGQHIGWRFDRVDCLDAQFDPGHDAASDASSSSGMSEASESSSAHSAARSPLVPHVDAVLATLPARTLRAQSEARWGDLHTVAPLPELLYMPVGSPELHSRYSSEQACPPFFYGLTSSVRSDPARSNPALGALEHLLAMVANPETLPPGFPNME